MLLHIMQKKCGVLSWLWRNQEQSTYHNNNSTHTAQSCMLLGLVYSWNAQCSLSSGWIEVCKWTLLTFSRRFFSGCFDPHHSLISVFTPAKTDRTHEETIQESVSTGKHPKFMAQVAQYSCNGKLTRWQTIIFLFGKIPEWHYFQSLWKTFPLST